MHWTADYVGLPFVDGGRDRAGVDCWGLVCLVFADRLGITLPGYGEISAAELLRVSRAMAEYRDAGPWRPVYRPAAFDVVLMRGTTEHHGSLVGVPCHVGVMADGQSLLHITHASSVVLVPRDHPSVRFRSLGVYRHASQH